ncbi:DUF4339 domain-containing protein [Roseiconus nitratireducens]|uniref:DUF4339 domain-containing protein n=1 Tax=Roseiconus nitratireducens TaxID=2605748 RepID=A0A5M6DDI0_9BACT|nr:GYF domain-containing protein [Roseiconus nitratireducens]KAA5543235.1 DUF4339 domain-containing protein [Roseiconus nitratireducens]
MSQWFLQRREGNVQTEVGPLSPHELLGLVRKGEIKPDTRLRKNDSAWFPANEVGGLFEAASRKEIQYFCPGCSRRVVKPPVVCPNCLREIPRGGAREIQPESSVAVPQPENPAHADEGKRSVQSWLKKKVGKKPS